MTYADAFNLRTTNVSFNNVADAIDGSFGRAWGGTTAGTSTAYTSTASPAWTAYAAGDVLRVIPHATNTGAATINVNGLGAKNIRWKNRALVGGEIGINIESTMVYDGTQFNLINIAGIWTTWTTTVTGQGTINITAATQTTCRFRADGDTFEYEVFLTNITSSTGTGNAIRFSIPTGSITGNPIGNGYLLDSTYFGAICTSASSTLLSVSKFDQSNLTVGAWSGRELLVSGRYRIS